MQKLLFLVALGLLLGSCNNTPPKTEDPVRSDLANAHLLGMVKTMEESSFTADSLGNIGEMDSCCVEIEHFNEKGFVMTYMEKDKSGAVTLEVAFTRAENGDFVSSKRTKNGEPDGGRTGERDADGNIITGIDTDGSGKVKYFYNDMTLDEYGQPILGKMYTGDSTFMGTWGINRVDGMDLGRSWRDSADKFIYDYQGEVNEKGWLVKQTGKVAAGEDSVTTTVTTYTYDNTDETGNWTQRTAYDQEGKVTEVKKRTYTYYKKE